MITIETDKSLKDYNTFGVEVVADQFIQFDGVDDVYEVDWSDAMIWGGGSNILCVSENISKVVYPNLKGIEIVAEEDQQIIVRIAASEQWDDLVAYCVDHGYGGIENLSLIPGKVGAAPIQNIGAYGVELKDVLQQVSYYDIEGGKVKSLSANECQFGYRDSIFKKALKGKSVILSIDLRLTKNHHQYNTSYAPLGDSYGEEDVVTLKNIREKVIAIRSSKLPDPQKKGQGNAGSFFKNPVISKEHLSMLKEKYEMVPNYPLSNGQIKIPAAWLIQQAGWKGRKLGQVQCNPLQPLVIMNLGGATGHEVYGFAQLIQNDVSELFDIQLEMEVNKI